MTTTSSLPGKPAAPIAPGAKHVVHHVPLWKRQTARWSRWLHTYLSMVSFTILLFFAVTGLTLNHQDFFTGIAKPTRFTGSLNAAWMKTPEAYKAFVADAFRSRHGIKAAMVEFRVDDDQVQVSYKGPGYAADGFIDRRTGKYDLNENRLGLIAVINDLHKGRDTGRVWSGVIDGSAILMVAVSLTGLVLIFFLNKKLRAGILALVIGTVLCYVAYLIWVP